MALAAPAGVCDPMRVARSVALLESWGLGVRTLPENAPRRYMSGSDSARGNHLEELFASAEVRAVLAARGGYGCSRLLETFDVELARRDRKIVVGFSDLTLLLNRLVSEASMVCYHGPMPAADLINYTPAAQERFRRFLFGEDDWWDGSFTESWRPGSGEGPLIGGCLSVLVTTLGTPYEIDTRGCLLFLEDVAEKPYRIDRMLTHLRHAGKLDQVAGVAFGPMLDCDDGQGPGVLREITMEVLAGTAYPVVYGVDAGHGSNNAVLPLGCRARLDGDGGGIELLEPAFAT